MKRMVHGVLGLLFVLGIVMAAAAQDERPPANPLKDQFFKKGIDIPDHGPFRLPGPLVNEDMTPQQVMAGLKAAAGNVPLKNFLQGGPFSPINLKVEPVPKSGPRQAHHIKLHMVALGKMDDVLKKNLLNQLIGGAKGKSKPLNAAQLKARNLSLLAGKGLVDQYDVLDMELLEKVNISGITRTIKTSGSQAAYTTTILDERFAKDKQHPNVWQHVDPNGKLIGKPHVYSGMGGYVLALQLPGRAGKDEAVYLEMHYILHEPKGWFGGLEVLRAKLPILVRENALEFRQKLARGKR